MKMDDLGLQPQSACGAACAEERERLSSEGPFPCSSPATTEASAEHI